jgi:alpha-ribazole phosphatase
MSAFHLHLLRHGAPEVPGLLLGRTDAAPTREGIAACIEQVAGLEFDAILSSDLQRASEPARAIGKARDLAIGIDTRWRELDFGDWDGLHPSAIAPEALERFRGDPDDSPPPGGERWLALVARVSTALAELPPRDTLVVTHGGAIRAALAALFGFDQRQIWGFELPYTVLLSLQVWPGSPTSAQIVGLRP